MAGDPDWDKVVLLLNLDGNSNDIKSHPFSNAGTVSYTTAKFNQGLTLTTGNSGLFSGLSVADFSFGTGDFTVEFWINPTTPPGDGVIMSLFDNATGRPNGWQILMTAAGVLRFYQFLSGIGGSYPITATGSDVRGSWHHVAVDRQGSTLRMYIDGVMVGKATNSTNFGSTGLYLSIGYQVQGAARYPYRGQIDEVRISKGLARYANDGGFSAPTEPFPVGPVGDNPAYLSQLPIIIAAEFNPAARLSQLPVIVSFLEYRPARVTQVPLQVAYLAKPVPLPRPVVPEIPVKETWSWKTALKEIYNGKEQRARLREYPRYKLNFTVLILEDQDRFDIYALLMRYLKQKFIYPIYHYNAFLTAPSLAGSNELYVSTQETDLRVGEKLALFDPQARTTSYYTVASVATDKVTVEEPLATDVAKNFQVFPAYEFRLGTEAGFTMRNVAGDFEVTMESVSDRSFLTPGANPSVTTKDDLLVVPEKYLTDDTLDESFVMGVDWVDSGTSLPENFNHWTNPFAKSTRTYKFDRRSGIHYWRKIADTLKGRQGVALFPTFRSDIDLRETPAPGSSTLVTNNTEIIKYWLEPNYRYVRVETMAGAVSYNKILDVRSLYDSDGYPYASQIKFESVLPSQIKLVSFMNMCRLDSDSVELTHYGVDSEIKFSIRAVNG